MREMKMWIKGYDSKRIPSLAQRIRHTGDLTNNVAKLLIKKCDMSRRQDLEEQLIRCEETYLL